MKPGFFELRTEHDLLKKLVFDFERIESNNNDTYAAFDFFVTATHIVEWMKNGDSTAAAEFRKQHVILKVCNHLACGGKHFSISRKSHDSIISSEKQAYVDDGYVEDGYIDDPLMVVLDEKQAEKLGLKNPIPVISLAEIAVNFWKSQLGS